MGAADTEASSWAKLNGPSDWKHWIAGIRKSATTKDVWDLIDPFKENKEPLVRPVFPTAADIKPDATRLSELTPEQRIDLNGLEKQYLEDVRIYEKRQKALSSIQDRIILTVGNYRDVIDDEDDVAKELALLRARIQPATWFHEREVLDRYRTALKGPSRTKTKDWVTSWQKVLTEARNLGLPDTKGLRPTLDFLEAVRPIDLTFADIWMNKIQYKASKGKADWEAKIPDGIEISELFEKQAAETKAPRGSFSTFQQSGSSKPPASAANCISIQNAII
ncbi:hypothetical protein BGZ61DRAFT_492122 [Ilyonectria robusta]|uniref:uncharacterized protein n=1 Tax=Ilyonectria robusta TaxID=1079257 RepID=UPI001E8CB285|nr:uncharacterized protein BGZ61DRAFT_492122 [Ilyonectria robusta]KAH8729982.1 hypothetical protein BGZ61DRAFT_492122 [Ilyonectria robusta]